MGLKPTAGTFLNNTNTMDTNRIIKFLCDVAANNNRPWFMEHKDEYQAVRADFGDGVGQAISRIAAFDPSVAHVTVKDATYRFYRDTRFSTDKSPYKTHLGAYIAAHGKKALHGGYYLHIEPGHCLVSCGNYWLPTNILTSCRNEIMANTEEWLRRVESPGFLRYFGADEAADWNSEKGFGLERLKTCPSGFPRDYAYMKYLRMKDYCCWHRVDDDFFSSASWLDDMATILQAGKPMMDFMNSVIDDYE